MAHLTQDTQTTIGLENTIRQQWSAGSKVKILSATTNDWVTAHIVTIHKDWLYCLLDDGDTKKIDRWDGSVQPHSTDTGDGGGEDDEDLVMRICAIYTQTQTRANTFAVYSFG